MKINITEELLQQVEELAMGEEMIEFLTNRTTGVEGMVLVQFVLDKIAEIREIMKENEGKEK